MKRINKIEAQWIEEGGWTKSSYKLPMSDGGRMAKGIKNNKTPYLDSCQILNKLSEATKISKKYPINLSLKALDWF